MIKNHLANAGDIRDAGSIPGGGHNNPLQYPGLEKLIDRRGWRTTVHRVAESDTTKAT